MLVIMVAALYRYPQPIILLKSIFASEGTVKPRYAQIEFWIYTGLLLKNAFQLF